MPVLASAVYDLVERIAAADSVPGVWNTYMEAARKAGFEHGIAAFDFEGGNLADFTFANSMPDGWLGNYSAKNYNHVDPLRRMNRNAPTAFSWDMAQWETCPTARDWCGDNRASGVKSGITIPDHSGGRLKIITLCGTRADLHPHDRIALHIAGLEMMHRVRELGIAPAKDRPRLSPRERECLQWIAAGKTDWEIGEILSLSGKTVNIYVERAKQKLGVQTRSQAIVQALRGGLIAP